MKVIDPNRIQGASSEVVRDINRRIVLNLIRTRHPISRADLARLCGLQRSTISLIVEQLIAESWVIEGPTGNIYWRFTGPEPLITANLPLFNKVIDSVKPQDK